VALLALSGAALAESAGQSRSTFVPREDGPSAGLAAPVVSAQAKADPLPPVVPGTRPAADPYEAYIRLEPPGRERLFGNRDTEKQLEERMRQERRDSGPGDSITFPDRPDLQSGDYVPRKFEPMVCLREPEYVVYRRLYFEEKNAERYGWELGALQPAVSSLAFFRDMVMLPHNFASYLCRRFETNAGQCLPGDPVPYKLYPPELTGSGLLAEVAVIALFAVAIP